MNPLMTQVTGQDGHCLLLEFDSGEARVFDLTSYLDKGVFRALRSRSLQPCGLT